MLPRECRFKDAGASVRSRTMNLLRRSATMLALAACAGAIGCAVPQSSPDSWAGVLDGDVDLFAACRQVLGEQHATHRNAAKVQLASAESASAPTNRRGVIASRATADGVVLASAEEPVIPDPLSFDLGPAASPADQRYMQPDPGPEPLPPSPELSISACHDGCCGHSTTCAVVPCPLATACGCCAGCLGGGDCKLFTRPDPGPPPMRYYPPMPPKFLPVPTQPVLSPARMDAPYPWRGDVEVGFRPTVTFPARD
jgi:hypothetical protein